MTKVAELSELPNDQVEERIRDLDDQVFRLRLQMSMGQTEAANKMKDLRRDRGRAKTLIREREIEAMRMQVKADG